MADILDTTHPWQNTIAVCTKCSGKIGQMDGDKTKLRVALKALVKERGIKNTVRPVDISCLDICPENKITVAHFTEKGIETVVVESSVTPEEILRRFGY